MQASPGVFRDGLAELEHFLPLQGVREGSTKMVMFDLKSQETSPQVVRTQ